jgi:hypothetical protein
VPALLSKSAGLDVPVRLLVRDRELLEAVIACEAIDYGSTPPWCSNRTTVLRRVASLVIEHGAGFFRRCKWKSGHSPLQQAAAVAIGQATVAQLFPELPAQPPA